MSEITSSEFSPKKFYVFVAIGLIIFGICTVFSYASKDKINSGDLSGDDLSTQKYIYSISKIGSMIGFIIALVPSVLILQKTVQKERDKTAEDSKHSKPPEIKKCDDDE